MFEWLSRLLQKTLSTDTAIHILGRNEFIIDNCRRIEECSDVFMRFLSAEIYITIRGNDLRAYDFRTGGLVVRGIIDQIEFEERNTKYEAENKKYHKNKRNGKNTL